MRKSYPAAVLLFALLGCHGGSKGEPPLPINIDTLNNATSVHYEEKDSGYFWVRNVKADYNETIQRLAKELNNSYKIKSNMSLKDSHLFSIVSSDGKAVVVSVFPGKTEASNLAQTVKGTESEWTTVMVATDK